MTEETEETKKVLEKTEAIAQSLMAKEEIKDIISMHNTSMKVIRAVAALYDIDVPLTAPKGRPSKEYPVEEWVEAHKQGKTIAVIAEEYNVSYPTVRKNLLEQNVSLQVGRRSQMDRFDKDTVEKLYKEGYTIQKLATEFNTSLPTIRKFMIESQIEIRGPGKRLKKEKEETVEVINTQSDLATDPEEVLEFLTVKELRELCEKHGVEVNGTKQEMCERIRSISNG